MRILGIDTGGTYTDGVIIDRETKKVLYTAKALTTHTDLTIGMEDCMRALAFEQWDQIEQVCLSTTLATNAIVENKGCRVGVITLGKKIAGELPADICVEIGAQVDIRGGERERLADSELQAALLQLRGRCDAVAVSGYASVRNPMHEKQVAQAVKELLGLPAVCGHELTGALGFYERTVTAALNAKLIPTIRNLITTVYWVMHRFGITAPIMVVRGDGSLMRADYAMERPVETVLSGPAASVIGAHFLSGQDECLVVDIGGTTTDIAHLKSGTCKVSDEGAILAGWHTRVRALAICTFGLGGDSEIHTAQQPVTIGPCKVTPFCRAQEGETAGLTPTDLLHVTGEYLCWDADRSRAALCAAGVEDVAPLRGRVVRQLAEYCEAGEMLFAVTSSVTLVGVGAPACTWLPDAAREIHASFAVPQNAEVANAVGAAVGQVREVACAFIRHNRTNGAYYLYTTTGRQRIGPLEQAEALAQETVRSEAVKKAQRAGADRCDISMERQEFRAENGTLIEIRLQATASGYPV